MDREKVIKGLTELKKYLPSTMWEPINNAIALLKEQEQMYYTLEHDWRMCRELLKEQEAVEPHYNARTNWYECGACKFSMTSGMHCKCELIPVYKVGFCAKCGQAVKWE